MKNYSNSKDNIRGICDFLNIGTIDCMRSNESKSEKNSVFAEDFPVESFFNTLRKISNQQNFGSTNKKH